MPTNITPSSSNDDYLVVPFLPSNFTITPSSRFSSGTSGATANSYFQIIKKSLGNINDYDVLPGIRILTNGKYKIDLSVEIFLQGGTKQINFYVIKMYMELELII